MAKLVTGTYGEALFELAIEEKKEKEMLEEVTLLSKILKENPDFSDMMNHPKILKEEKIEEEKGYTQISIFDDEDID